MNTTAQKPYKFKQTEIGEIPKDWEIARLIDYVDIDPPRDLKRGQLAKYIPMANVQPFEKKVYSYEAKPYNGGSRFINGDTLLARITPCLENGKTAYVDFLDTNEVSFGSTEFIVLSNKEEKTERQFVYYLARSSRFREIAIKSMVGSSGRQRVQEDKLAETIFPFPHIDTQQQIASILSSLDDKIELNRKMNKTLGEIGKALFRRWFVDFEFPNDDGKPYKSSDGEMVDSELGGIPSGWQVKDLAKIADFQNGFAFYTLGYSPSGMKVVDLLNIDSTGNFKQSDKDKFVSEDIYTNPRFGKYILQKDDLVMAMTDMTQDMGILGKCGRIYSSNKFILNQRIGRFRAKSGIDINFLQSYLNSPFINEHLKGISLGTVQKYVNTYHIIELKFVIPTPALMSQYSKFVESIFLKRRTNDLEIQTLSILRDSLLPRLISGKLRIKV